MCVMMVCNYVHNWECMYRCMFLFTYVRVCSGPLGAIKVERSGKSIYIYIYIFNNQFQISNNICVAFNIAITGNDVITVRPGD